MSGTGIHYVFYKSQIGSYIDSLNLKIHVDEILDK